ncbi:hypothetical protein CRG98_037773 [Punica granatum]|uniref:Uncharacterized protein n=1 Tax=Punica granatum TaxID=22663 RepID=A0A2I0IEQ6_PUNGR|nr:hypothetical protein CRG98_037773 [Punica granatum]
MLGWSPKAVNAGPRPNAGPKPNTVNAGPKPDAEPKPNALNAVNARPKPKNGVKAQYGAEALCGAEARCNKFDRLSGHSSSCRGGRLKTVGGLPAMVCTTRLSCGVGGRDGFGLWSRHVSP